MDDKKSLLTTLPPLLVAAGTLITAVIGLGNFMSSPAPSITEFDVLPTIIDTGGNATLKWVVSGDVSSISIDPDIGVVALSGSRQISPANTTNYTLTAENKGQFKTASAQLIVRPGETVESVARKSDNNSIQNSIQTPAPLSAPSSANNVGDEPVHNEVPTVVVAAKNADSANNANTINTADAMEKTVEDKSSIPSEPKQSESYHNDAGDEPIPMSSLERTSEGKETIEHTNTNASRNRDVTVGNEPIQLIVPKSADVKNASGTSNAINQTISAKAADGKTTTEAPTTTKAQSQSGVGDIA